MWLLISVSSYRMLPQKNSWSFKQLFSPIVNSISWWLWKVLIYLSSMSWLSLGIDNWNFLHDDNISMYLWCHVGLFKASSPFVCSDCFSKRLRNRCCVDWAFYNLFRRLFGRQQHLAVALQYHRLFLILPLIFEQFSFEYRSPRSHIDEILLFQRLRFLRPHILLDSFGPTTVLIHDSISPSILAPIVSLV